MRQCTVHNEGNAPVYKDRAAYEHSHTPIHMSTAQIHTLSTQTQTQTTQE